MIVTYHHKDNILDGEHLQGGESSEQYCQLVEGPAALRPDEGISHQETGDRFMDAMIKDFEDGS